MTKTDMLPPPQQDHRQPPELGPPASYSPQGLTPRERGLVDEFMARIHRHFLDFSAPFRGQVEYPLIRVWGEVKERVEALGWYASWGFSHKKPRLVIRYPDQKATSGRPKPPAPLLDGAHSHTPTVFPLGPTHPGPILPPTEE